MNEIIAITVNATCKIILNPTSIYIIQANVYSPSQQQSQHIISDITGNRNPIKKKKIMPIIMRSTS